MHIEHLNKRSLVFFVILIIVLILAACGNNEPSEQQQALEQAGLVEPSRGSPESAAEAVFNIWIQKRGIPNRDVRYEEISNDGTFAQVSIDAWFRKSSNSEWTENISVVDCKKIGRNWECASGLIFEEVYTPPPPTWKIYLTHVSTGEKANALYNTISDRRNSPKDGWKYVMVDLVLENISDKWAWLSGYKSTTSNIPAIEGVLVDSKNYERELQIYARPYAGGLYDSPEFPVPPSFRISMLAIAEIPENTDPASVVIQLPDTTDTTILDVDNPTTGLKIPVDSSATNIIKDLGYSFIFQDRKVTIKNVEITKYSYGEPGEVVTVDVENTGGYDISISDYDAEFWAIDNHGHYSGDDNFSDPGINRGALGGSPIAPGQVKIGAHELKPFSHHLIDDIDAVWVIVLMKFGDEAKVGLFKATKLGGTSQPQSLDANPTLTSPPVTIVPRTPIASNDIGTETIPISQMESFVPWLPDNYDSSRVPSTSYIRFNIKKPPFDNVLVRQAFSMAVDKNQIVNYLNARGGSERVATSNFVPPDVLGRKLYSEVGFSFDAEGAKSLLALAGYPSGNGFPSVTIVTPDSDYIDLVADNWRAILGVDINVVSVSDWNSYLDLLKSDPPQMYSLGWAADYIDPDNFLSPLFRSNADLNYTNYSNPELDTMIDKAVSVGVSPSERQSMYIQMDKIVSEDDAVIIPLFSIMQI